MNMRVAGLLFCMMYGAGAYAMQQNTQQDDAELMRKCTEFVQRAQRLNLQVNSPEYAVGGEQPFFCKFTKVKNLLEQGPERLTTYYTNADDKKNYIGAYTPSFKFLEPLLEKRDGYDDFQMLAYVYSPDCGYTLPEALATMYQNFTANQDDEICFDACQNIQILARETRKQLLAPSALAETKKQLQQTLDAIKPLSAVADDVANYERGLTTLINKQEWSIADYIAITKRHVHYKPIIEHAQKLERERKEAQKSLDETLEKSAEKSKERAEKIKKLENELDELADKKQALNTFARRMCIAVPILAAGVTAVWWYFCATPEQEQEKVHNT